MSSETHDNNVLSAIGPLRTAGFALHWLHPRSKRPIGESWSERAVASLDDLRRTHSRGNNLGLRLGTSSLTNAGYVHLIDMDIRIADCAEEAWDAFARLFPGIDPEDFPCVVSGSGGESRHLYFVTDRPFYGKKLAVSEGKHRRFDKDRDKEVWSYDWEIELFGTGKQVVLPPSIHPDSGKPYRWEREFDLDALSFGDGPEIDSDLIESLGAAETGTYEFETREPLEFKNGQLDRVLALIPDERIDDYHDWIALGQALHHQFGASDAGFDLWIEHSKRSEKFDGSPGFLKELKRKWRGFGRNRRQPVTMATVCQWAGEARAQALADQFEELDGEDAFDGSCESAGTSSGGDFDDLDSPSSGDGDGDDFDGLIDDDDLAALDLSDEERAEDAEAAKERAARMEWMSLLHYNEDSAVKPTLHNLTLIVQNDIWTRGVAAFNEFTQEIVQRGRPGVKKPKRRNQAKDPLQVAGPSFVIRDPVNGDFWTEDKDNVIRARLEAPETQGGYGIKVSDRDLRSAIDIAGRQNAFHPVREYLSGLTWDGTPRIERLFIDYVGAPDDNYHRHVASLTMVAAVTRVFEPGHKFDFAVILEGLQGKRKSSFIKILARYWFDELDGDFTDAKQMVELMQGAWILEIPELSGFARADVRHIKAFISRTSDKVRLAYAKRAQQYHRQCIFIGSTNDDRYLKDDTGGRRYWPVTCTVEEIDTDRLEAEVDQLWAEALVAYRAMRERQPRGTLPLYLTDEESKIIAARRQESARVESADDALAGQIAAWLDRPASTGGMDDDTPQRRMETCLLELWVECLGKDRGSYTQQSAQTLGRAMRLVPGWHCWGSFYSHRVYGRQRRYYRGTELEFIAETQGIEI